MKITKQDIEILKENFKDMKEMIKSVDRAQSLLLGNEAKHEAIYKNGLSGGGTLMMTLIADAKITLMEKYLDKELDDYDRGIMMGFKLLEDLMDLTAVNLTMSANESMRSLIKDEFSDFKTKSRSEHLDELLDRIFNKK